MIQTASMVLRGGVKMLSPVVGDTAARDARALMAHVLGVDPGRLTTELSRTVNPAQVSQFEHLVRRRMAREPISQIVGFRLFWGRRFQVTRDVLDPRPETETLIETALSGRAPDRILDLGTGTGCILLTLLAEWPDARGTGVDLSAVALEVATRNVAALGLGDRANLLDSNWYDRVDGQFDLIVSNPPYVAAAEMAALQPEVRDWEPELALSPGGDGLDAYRVLAKGLDEHLSAGGRALFEIGAGQGAEVHRILTDTSLGPVQFHHDLDGRDRVVEICREKG